MSMSSRKAATAKAAVRRSTAAQPAAKSAAKVVAAPAGKPATKTAADKTAAESSASKDATQLAATIERGLREGQLDTLSPQAFQALMAALCKTYSAQIEAGNNFMPLSDRNAVSPTEIMVTTSSLLKASNLAVFELGMWQSWTGR
jgi:hypothetical protein